VRHGRNFTVRSLIALGFASAYTARTHARSGNERTCRQLYATASAAGTATMTSNDRDTLDFRYLVDQHPSSFLFMWDGWNQAFFSCLGVSSRFPIYRRIGEQQATQAPCNGYATLIHRLWKDNDYRNDPLENTSAITIRWHRCQRTNPT
jgi:hypothetical protein